MQTTELKYGLEPTDIKDIISTIKQFTGVQSAILFGSRAMGKEQSGLDIDICLKGNEITHHNLLDILVALDDLELPYKFDVLIYDKISEPALKAHIDRVGKILF